MLNYANPLIESQNIWQSFLALITWMSQMWPLGVVLIIVGLLWKLVTKKGTSLPGAILIVAGILLAAPAIAIGIGNVWGNWYLPAMERGAPVVASKSRTGQEMLNIAEEGPCSVPGLGRLCGDYNPDDAGALASGEQSSAAAGEVIAPIPTGPQPVLLEGEEALRTCYQAWYASFSVDGAAKIMAGLPPDGKSKVTDWIPSTAGNATLVVQTPAGINNNTGTLSHWLLPAPIVLAQDELKLWHDDSEGTWSVAGTGSWPENCYTQPAPASPPTTAVAPVTPPSVSPPEGLTLYDAAGGSLFVPAGTPLVWCVQDPSVGAWYACAPNQQWFWRP